jgi:hypothetical protein
MADALGHAIVNKVAGWYRELGFTGASSQSGAKDLYHKCG